MMRLVAVMAAAFVAVTQAQADEHGDATKGEAVFKKCQSCHVVQDADGNVLAGRGARTGPNLYGVVGRIAGSLDGFRYKRSTIQAGEAGLVWTEEDIAKWALDPTGFLREYLGDKSARAGMSFRLRKEKDAADVAAFLATFSKK